MNNGKQPWIGQPVTDILFILLPPFVCLALIMLFPGIFLQTEGMSDAWWVILVVLIDVSHVYSTLYRTYADPVARQQHRNKLMMIPFASFVAMVLLYTTSALLFWRVLAYIAVFHFIRQQYGFMRIYSRYEASTEWQRRIHAIAIYTCTVYPILFWHLSGDRQFHWFVDGDFIPLPAASQLLSICTMLYLLVLFVYLLNECRMALQQRYINIPRNTVVLGTALSWYFGIVYFNGDLSFTLLNVVSHGIPYMALVWLYGKKSMTHKNAPASTFLKWVFGRYGILLFLGIIFLLAYVEEGLWDLTVWKEHFTVFGIFHQGKLQLNNTVLAIVVPLLTLPQITHYIIDGFIWRVRKNDLEWSKDTNPPASVHQHV